MAYRFEYRASFWQDYSAALAYIAGSLKNPLAAGVYGGLLVCNTFPPRHCEPVTDVTTSKDRVTRFSRVALVWQSVFPAANL